MKSPAHPVDAARSRRPLRPLVEPLETRLLLAAIPPIGSLDRLTARAAVGWALDRNTPAAAITIRLDIDGITFATPSANLARPDLVPYYGSANHGFSLALPAMSYGLHRIDLYAYDSTTLTVTLITSRQLNTNLPPTGFLDSLTGEGFKGWAFDPNSASASIQIRFAIDNNAPIITTAKLSRPDLTPHIGSSLHGFDILMPAPLPPGKHSVTVWAVDSTNKSLVPLGTKSVNIGSPPGDPFPRGHIDIISATEVAGWVHDASDGTAPLTVRIDVDNVTGTPFIANLSRPDLVPVIGSANHGFSQSLTLSPGFHTVTVFTFDNGTGTPIFLGYQIVNNPAPTGWLDSLTQSSAQGWAFLPGLAGGPATVRLDIDNIATTPVTANLARPDLTPILGSSDHGFFITLPKLLPGRHTAKLVLLDPQTLIPITLASTSLQTF